MINHPNRSKKGSHTRGPWDTGTKSKLAERMGEPRHECCVFEENDLVANTDFGSDRPYEEKVANARLIAAAPELLAALELALPQLSLYANSVCMTGGSEDGPEPACAAVRSAIAKARIGRQQESAR